MDMIVGIGEYAISDRAEDIIRTYALGTCVAVTMYSPARHVMGMAHIALPDSRLDPEHGKTRPAYFADTAVPLLIEKLAEYGCGCNALKICLCGGAISRYKNDVFQVGQRNIKAVKRELECRGLFYHDADVGGRIGRSIEARVATGEIKIERHRITL